MCPSEDAYNSYIESRCVEAGSAYETTTLISDGAVRCPLEYKRFRSSGSLSVGI